MRDGSDAIADWPILNALLNIGGGRDVGQRPPRRRRRDRQLDPRRHGRRRRRHATTRPSGSSACSRPIPGTGVMRHADAGYDEALDAAREHGLDLPERRLSACRGCSSATSRRSSRPPGATRRCAGARSARSTSIEDALRPLRRTARSPRSGAMRDLGPLDGDVEELDGRGLCAIPGLVDCHTHPAFGGDRVDEFALRAGGASYEELHAAGGGILSTVRATRAAGEDGLARGGRAPPRLDAARRHDDVRGEVGLRARPRDRARVAARDPRRRAASRPGSARTPSRPSSTTPTRTSTSRSRRCSRRRRSSPRRPTSSSSAARSTPRRRAATSRRAATQGLALRLHGDQFTEAGAIPLAIELGARSVDHLEATGAGRRRARSPRATSSACCCPRARSSSAGRCRRRARSSTRARPSRSRPTSTPAARSARACRSSARSPRRSCSLSPAEALAACTVNAAHVLGRADRLGPDRARLRRRPRPARRARLALPRLPPRRRPRRGRRQGRRRRLVARGILSACRRRSSAAASRS